MKANPQPAYIDDVLLFPRRTVKMAQARTSGWISTSWFRTNKDCRSGYEFTRSLPTSTDLTMRGLQSGLRSAIIKKNGKYFRLKGINPSLRNSSLTLKESLTELGMAGIFHEISEIACAIIPAYLEVVPTEAVSEQQSTTSSNHPSRRLFDMRLAGIGNMFLRSINEILDTYNGTNQSNYEFVPCFLIKGDTRLDEAIYHLTLRPLRGERKIARDSLLEYLSFHAGRAKAVMVAKGFVWGTDFTNTDNHIGNYVVYSKDEKIMVGFTDLGKVSHAESVFKKKNILKQFQAHVLKEVTDHKDDFFEDETFYLPGKFFKHFSIDLRSRCYDFYIKGFNSKIMNSYSDVFSKLLDANQFRKLPVEDMNLSTSDFYSIVEYIQK